MLGVGVNIITRLSPSTLALAEGASSLMGEPDRSLSYSSQKNHDMARFAVGVLFTLSVAVVVLLSSFCCFCVAVVFSVVVAVVVVVVVSSTSLSLLSAIIFNGAWLMRAE